MSPTARPEGFEGDLGALSVVEIVQTLSLGGKTARFLVRSDALKGEMWFKDGELTHAATGTLFGDLAVYAMIELTAGHFVVEYGRCTEARSITQDATFLVLEGLRRFDERSQGPASSTAERVEVPLVSEADVRRAHVRRRVVRFLAVGAGAAAIIIAVVYGLRSPSATDAVAAVPPAAVAAPVVAPKAPALSARAAKRSSSWRPALETKAVAAPKPIVTAPESPAAEEPVPLVAAAAAVAAVAPAVTPDALAPRLRIAGTSSADGGSLTVFIDGAPAYKCEQLAEREPFEAELVLTPGAHLIAARLEDGARAGVHEASTRSVFTPGESRLLRITANRALGSAVKVKLDRVPPG